MTVPIRIALTITFDTEIEEGEPVENLVDYFELALINEIEILDSRARHIELDWDEI